MKCDACGAPVENGRCTYCGKSFIKDEFEYDSAPSRNRSRESQQTTTVVNNVYTTPTTVIVKEKKRFTLGRLLLWIFFLPIMATIAVWKSNWKVLPKLLVTAVIWIFCLGVGGLNSQSSSTDTASSSPVPVANNPDETKSAETNEAEPETAQTVEDTTIVENVPENNTYTIGETAEFNGIQTTLKTAIISNGSSFAVPKDGKKYLGLVFDISNGTTKDVSVSSILSFEAYCDDYATNVELMAYMAPEWDGMNQIDGTAAAGKKLNGVIAYEVPADFQTFEIRYKPSFWSGKEAIFTFTSDQVDKSGIS